MRTAFAINAAQRAGQGTALEHNAQQSGGYHSFTASPRPAVRMVAVRKNRTGAARKTVGRHG